jgi:hypothetical protein
VQHYIYVSDTKVDMLAAQVPRRLRDQIAADLKLDVKVLAVSIKQAPAEETRYSKLALITRYLTHHGDVGTMDEPKAYFMGTLPMRWGELRDWKDRVGPAGSPAIYFVGETDATVVALGGSMRHVLGTDTPLGYGELSGSLAPPLVKLLHRNASEDFPEDDDSYGGWDRYERTLERVGAGRYLNHPELRLAPAEPFDFLARRLRYWPRSGEDETKQAAVLGSPIWVAYADS